MVYNVNYTQETLDSIGSDDLNELNLIESEFNTSDH